MNRLTFGVSCSPYLAVRTLQQVAPDFSTPDSPASQHIVRSFYVDDLLGGADSVEEAVELYTELRSSAGFNLRKWRSSSAAVLSKIPLDSQEPVPTKELVDKYAATYPRALGLIWDSVTDTMSVHIDLPTSFTSTKRGIVSDVSRTFDVLGWLSPAILPIKVLFQRLWEEKLGWDDEVPENLKAKHRQWREELPKLATIKLVRCYFHQSPAVHLQLHGFCDASEAAMAAVVYIRTSYSDEPPICRLVTSKTRVAPLKVLSIPRLELAGASLLAKVLTSTREALGIPLSSVHAWSDSSIVLAWLDGAPRRYRTFIGNRISSINTAIPSSAWKHVPSLQNPADCASRGLTPGKLCNHNLWWNGPPWLAVEPIQVPQQPHSVELVALKEVELKPSACLVAADKPTLWIETKFSSYRTLLHVTAWVQTFAQVFLACVKHHTPIRKLQLTPADITSAELFHRKSSQSRSYSSELTRLNSCPPQAILNSSSLLKLHPFFGTGWITPHRRTSLPVPHCRQSEVSSHNVCQRPPHSVNVPILPCIFGPLWSKHVAFLYREPGVCDWS